MNSLVSVTYYFLYAYVFSKWDIDSVVPGMQMATKAGNEDEITMESIQLSIFLYMKTF